MQVPTGAWSRAATEFERSFILFYYSFFGFEYMLTPVVRGRLASAQEEGRRKCQITGMCYCDFFLSNRVYQEEK